MHRTGWTWVCVDELIKSNFFERFRDCMHKLTDSSELRCKNRKWSFIKIFYVDFHQRLNDKSLTFIICYRQRYVFYDDFSFWMKCWCFNYSIWRNKNIIGVCVAMIFMRFQNFFGFDHFMFFFLKVKWSFFVQTFFGFSVELLAFFSVFLLNFSSRKNHRRTVCRFDQIFWYAHDINPNHAFKTLKRKIFSQFSFKTSQTW